MKDLLVLAKVDNARDARRQARRISEHTGEQLAPLLDALVTRAGELERLRQLAGRDDLTGLANRRTFNDVLERELARCHRAQQPLSLLLLDLDDLKVINDRYGHPAGDRALCEVARSAEAAVRQEDLVARLGGDEFAVILPQTSETEALAIGERIQHELNDAPAHDVDLGLSIGVVCTRDAPPVAAELLREGDRALYCNKIRRKSRHPLDGSSARSDGAFVRPRTEFGDPLGRGDG